MKLTDNAKKASVIFLFSLAGIFVSCTLINDLKNMQVPDSVAVKSSAEYTVPLGKATSKLKDHLSVTDLIEKIQENSSAGGNTASVEVYDYYDVLEPAVQKFLFNYSLAEIPLDVSSYLENLDQLDLSGTNSFSQKINVDKPDVSQSKDITSELDFNKLISDMIKVEINKSNGGLVIPCGLSTTLSDIDVYFTSPSFDSIEFETGALVLTLSDQEDGLNDGCEIQIRAALSDTSGNEISSTEKSVVRSSSDNFIPLVIPMDGKTLNSAVKLTLFCETTGEIGRTLHCDGILSVSESTKVKKITDVTIADSALSPYYFDINTTIDTAFLSDTVKSAVISDGAMYYFVDIPSSWTGISINPTVSMSGDMEVESSDFSTKSSDHTIYRSASLNGKTFTPETGTTLTGSVAFSVKNATLVLSDSDKIIFEGGAQINKLTNAKIYLDKILDTSALNKSISQELSEDVTKYIKTIFFKEIGLKGSIETDLPPSNMVLDGVLSSSFFGILPGEPLQMETVDFSGASPYEVLMVKDYGEDMLEKPLTAGDSVDFSIDMDLGSSDALNPDLVTISSFELGHEYSFDFNIGLVFDWEKIVLKTGAQSFDGTIDTGMNLSSFLSGDISDNALVSEIMDKTQFKEDAVKGYIYITRPSLEALNDFNGFHGHLTAVYDGSSGAILPESDLNFVTVTKTFAELADENYLITDISRVEHSGELDGAVLVNIINQKPESLSFDYSLSMAGSGGEETITVYKSDIDTLESAGYATSIKISIAMILGLKLELTDDIHIDNVFTSFGAEMEDDLLGRESADEESDFEKYADMVKNIRLEYLFQNNIGIKMNAYFVAENESGVRYLGWDSVKGEYTKEIVFKTGSNYNWKTGRSSLNLTRGDIKNIFANYKFIPQIILDIPASEITVPRDASISVQAVLAAQTDNEYVIWGGEDD